MTPILLLTRPEGRNAAISEGIAAKWDGPLQVVTSPLLKISFVASTPPDADALIFTSVNGVDAAVHMGLPSGQTAWCVGGRTAEAAKAAGFAVLTGPGDAQGLIDDITSAQPSGRLAHIRGRHTRGSVAETLTAAGLNCADVVAYDQVPIDLSEDALLALTGEIPVILPLFSPRTASILIEQGPFRAAVHVVAMSDAVAEVAAGMQKVALKVAKRPDAASVVEAAVALLAGMSSR